MKICMVAASLAGGGAERALLDTASLLAARGHEVAVLTFETAATDAYEVPEGVSRSALGVPGWSGNRLRGIQNNVRRIVGLRAEVQRLQPDVVISYLTRTNIICLLALSGTKRPLVATEHNVAALNDAPMQVVWRTLRRLLYRHMTQVVTVSEGLAKQYRWLRPDRLSVIHNFLPEHRGAEPETFPFLSPSARYIVGMGRLEPEKGFDKLIEAFHRVAKDCPSWNLLIVGEGSLRMELAAMVASLGLAGRVALPGRVRNPRTLLRQCDLFALSSESEGFGLVLLEAMSAGLPVVSFDCDFGPREIVMQDVSGVLVPAGDVPALAQAINKLAKNDALRARLARGGLETVGQFAPGEIMNQWETLLRRVTKSPIAPRELRLPAQATERS